MLAACSARPPPALRAVAPTSGELGATVELEVLGEDFARAVLVDLDRPSRSQVNDTYFLSLGGVLLEQVQYVDRGRLTARVPGTVPAGTHDLVLTDPFGRTATLPAAFTVKDSQALAARVRIETAPGGAGVEVGDVQVRAGRSVALFAVARFTDGGFASDSAAATWTLTGVGALSPAAGAQTSWSSAAVGAAQVQVSAPQLGTDATGTLTALPCTSTADCADPCTGSVACVAGVCQSGASTRDGDGDGYVDARCPGGSDCDDADNAVRPGAAEGPEGSPSCADGKDNDCDALADLAEVSCQPNTPPLARLELAPQVVAAGSPVNGTSAGSSDLQDAPGALTYEWDWDADGAYEAVGPTSAHTFAAAGQFPVVLRVTDTRGARAYATATALVVAAAASIATVTTGVDEGDPGATPANPLGAGLSLREAVAWARATPGVQSIVVPAGTTVALTRQLDLTDNAGVNLLGNGAVVDGAGLAGAGSSCFDISGRFIRIDGFEIRGCPGWPIYAHGQDTVVTRCRIHDNAYGVEWEGANDTFGPDNEVWRCGSFGIDVNGVALVTGNSFHEIPTGPGILLRAAADNSGVVGNVVWGCMRGIDVATQASTLKLWHNTLHANARDGVLLSPASSGHDVRDNIATGNGGWGVDAAATSIGAIDANDLFQNGLGGCRACGALGPKAVSVAPGYVDAAAGDLRIFSASPLVNAGVDTGADRNGPAPGNYNGVAPDIGAFETQQ